MENVLLKTRWYWVFSSLGSEVPWQIRVHIHHWICRQHANIQRRIQKNRSPAEKEKKEDHRVNIPRFLSCFPEEAPVLKSRYSYRRSKVLSIVFLEKSNKRSEFMLKAINICQWGQKKQEKQDYLSDCVGLSINLFY